MKTFEELSKEIYKDVAGYKNYEISNYGNVRNKRTKKIRKKIIGNMGYYICTLSENGKIKTHLIHRLIAEAFIKNPNNKPQINHKDSDRLNNSLDNLEWCTRKENMRHGFQQGYCSVINAHEGARKQVAIYYNCGKLMICDSIKEAAKIIGVNRKTIYRWGKKKHNPKKIDIAKIDISNNLGLYKE